MSHRRRLADYAALIRPTWILAELIDWPPSRFPDRVGSLHAMVVDLDKPVFHVGRISAKRVIRHRAATGPCKL